MTCVGTPIPGGQLRSVPDTRHAWSWPICLIGSLWLPLLE